MVLVQVDAIGLQSLRRRFRLAHDNVRRQHASGARVVVEL